MRELKERLTEVDRVEFPEELWSAALRRAAGEGVQEPITRSPFRPAGRIAATTVAFAVFIAAAFFLWNAFESRSERPRPGETTPSPNPLSQLPAGWNKLPDPPDVRAGSAAAWTGSKLSVWGGYVYTGFSDEEPIDDGYLLDPLTGDTETLPVAPLTARAFPAVAWTGSELIVWGGWDLHDGFFDDGAAYDPASGEWRALPPAPIEARMPFSAWTGSELVVWGSKWRDARLVDGAAYDPAADSWRRIADAPLELTDGTAVWTGKEMIVFGAALNGGNQAESETAIGAAYDPAADSWRLLPDSQLSPQASTAAWNGQRMIAWDYLNQAQTYDPDRDEWGPVEGVPLQDFECSPQSVSVFGSVLGDYCGQTTSYGDGGWSDISRRKYVGWGFELVAADPAVLLLGSNVDTGANVLLAYRVPDVGSTTTATAEPPTSSSLPAGNLDHPITLQGVPFPVCDVDSLTWLYEEDGFGQAFTFEASVSDLCDSAVEGPQYLGVTTEPGEGISRADAYFGPLERCVEPTGCWVYSTPELDADPPDEILILTNGGPDGIEVWFFDVAAQSDGFELRPFEAVCPASAECDSMVIRRIDWETPGLSGLSCGRFAPDGSYSYSPGNDFYEWTSERGDGWTADRWTFSEGRAEVDPLREVVSHGDPRQEFAPSDDGEICLEPAAVPPSFLAD